MNYLKSPAYRTIHADGAMGGATPDLNIYFAVWSQRGALADISVHDVSEGGRFNPAPSEVITKSPGMIREVECGVVMSLATAKNFYQWLGERIAETDEAAKREPEGSGVTQ